MSEIQISRANVRIPRVAVEQQAAELIAEVRDMFAQYQREVPRKRKPWPESIRSRIHTLWGLGVGCHQIALEAGVPVQTLYSWRQRIKKGKDTAFAQIPVARSARRTGFQIQVDEDRRREMSLSSQLEMMSKVKSSTVTVVVSSGLRIEDLTVEQAILVARRLS